MVFDPDQFDDKNDQAIVQVGADGVMTLAPPFHIH